MNIKYSILRMMIPQRPDKPGKSYAKAQIHEEGSPHMIANEMAYADVMTDGDVLHILGDRIRICLYLARMPEKALPKANFEPVISVKVHKKAACREIAKVIHMPDPSQTQPHKLHNLTA